MAKIDQAFCFASAFEIQISDILAGMPDALQNAKAPTLRAFEDDNTFWDEYTECGHAANHGPTPNLQRAKRPTEYSNNL
jgi:hypothetical protein